MHLRLTLSLVLIAASTFACANKPVEADTITVGSSYADAKALLGQWGATETQLAMAPPEREDGTFLRLESFMVNDRRALSIVYDPQRDGAIVSLSICDGMANPKADREWRWIDRFPLPE